MIIISEDTLIHYGTPRHSGRYPWGSGGNEEHPQDNMTFLSTIDELKKQGLSDTEVAGAMGMTTTEYRARKSIAINERKAARIGQAQRLHDSGMGATAIGKEMGIPESSVRSLLKPGEVVKLDRLTSTANVLKEAIGTNNLIDVGTGVEHYMGVSRSMLNTAIKVLEQEGYRKPHIIKMPQLGTKHDTTYQVMAPKGMTPKEVFARRGEIQQIQAHSSDGGKVYEVAKYPTSVSSKRVGVVWKEDGGALADGVIYVRRGVKDISLGGKNYAQVRILVDGTHYLKGMALYKDNLPKGIDLEFHTNKSKTENSGVKLKALKEISNDPERPFKASIRRQHGVMNIVNEEGDWDAQRHDFSSQFLSKQSPTLAKQQLEMTYESRKHQLDEIMSLTNPTVRKKLLEDFAEDVDSAAVHLRAASLPRTSTHVILPVHSMKETEIYAPNFNNGDRVALVRHPHGGPFEIPQLTVNNKNPQAKSTIGTMAQDAVGIHPKVAEKLSGADFDGDFVLVIRNNQGIVKSSPSLEGLKNFDPKQQYKEYPGMHRMTEHETQHEMGHISNLITDMTIGGAGHDEIVRAVRHSMVVIDAEKHFLDYKQSEIDNGIKALKTKWQKPPKYGASTLISRASSKKVVPERKQWTSRHIDPRTGEKIFTPTGASFIDKTTGKVIVKKTTTTKLSDEKDAFKLSSGTPIETIYATHSNRLKAMANAARKEAYHTESKKYAPSAAKAHASEVASLKSKLIRAQKNAPLERQAQVVGNAQVRLRMQHKPNMPKEEIKAIKNRELKIARERTGAGKEMIEITDREWEAIQAGAISPSMLSKILNNTKLEVVKTLATPKSKLLMTSAKTTRAKSMLASGYTQAEVAAALGVSLTTLKTGIK